MNEPTPVPLNLTDEWEDLVNNSQHRKARKLREAGAKAHQIDELVNKAILFACGAALPVMLNFYGLISAWVASPIALACLLAVSFIVGRTWETYTRRDA